MAKKYLKKKRKFVNISIIKFENFPNYGQLQRFNKSNLFR